MSYLLQLYLSYNYYFGQKNSISLRHVGKTGQISIRKRGSLALVHFAFIVPLPLSAIEVQNFFKLYVPVYLCIQRGACKGNNDNYQNNHNPLNVFSVNIYKNTLYSIRVVS